MAWDGMAYAVAQRDVRAGAVSPEHHIADPASQSYAYAL